MSSHKASVSDAGPSRLLQGVLGNKANASHNSLKVWRQLNMPVSTYDLLKPNVFSLPEKLLRHSAKLKPLRGPHERKRKKGVKSKWRLRGFVASSIVESAEDFLGIFHEIFLRNFSRKFNEICLKIFSRIIFYVAQHPVVDELNQKAFICLQK